MQRFSVARWSKRLIVGLLIAGGVLTVTSCISAQLQPGFSEPLQSIYKDGKFENFTPRPLTSAGDMLGTMKQYLFDKRLDPAPAKAVPLQQITQQSLADDRQKHTGAVVYRLGHSSILLSLDSGFWLTDPVFSKRASPVQWAGPKRFHPAPITVEELPEIEGVILSHNHYDHLDQGTIEALHQKVKHFYVPLGIGQSLQAWGVAKEKITEFDWWQQQMVGDVKLVATPSQHFSGRGLFDSNKSLWASWVIETPKQSIFFSGDTGYFEGFKEIGQRFGPFDLTLMENGAYNKNWAYVHMTPEESIQAHIDLQGKVMLPIHNSTFDLSLHAWYEPLARVVDLGQQKRQHVITPTIGQAVPVSEANQSFGYWWKDMVGEQVVEQLLALYATETP